MKGVPETDTHVATKRITKAEFSAHAVGMCGAADRRVECSKHPGGHRYFAVVENRVLSPDTDGLVYGGKFFITVSGQGCTCRTEHWLAAAK